MSEHDELLSAALSETFDREINSIEHLEKVTPSDKLKHAVEGLCKKENPRKFFSSRYALKRCAIFALVFLSSTSLFIITAPKVSGALQRVIWTWTDKALEFNFEGKSAYPDAVSVNISYFPEGYRMTDSWEDFPDYFDYSWNDHEEWEWEWQICLSGIQIHKGASVGIDNEHSDITDIDFSAQDVIYLKSNTPGYCSYLSWTLDGYSFLLSVPGNFSEEETIKIAEGIELVY